MTICENAPPEPPSDHSESFAYWSAPTSTLLGPPTVMPSRICCSVASPFAPETLTGVACRGAECERETGEGE